MKRYIDEMQSRGREIENEVDSKNLFDSGITRAIKSARQSLGLDQDQEHKAIRKGLFRFSDALTQQYGDPRFTNRKGAVNNLASIAPAMAKGLEGYEDASDKIEHNNQEVYEWAKKFRDSEIKRLRDQDKEAFDRYFADKKLGIELAKLDEQRDYHKGMLENKNSANQKETPFDKKHKLGLEGLKMAIAEATKTINYNKALAESTGKSSKGEAGFTRRKLNDFGLMQLTPEQAEIETLGSLLSGYGNKLMNFTNQVEFESLPHISPYYSDEANLAILKKMQDIMVRDADGHGSIGTYDNTSTPAIMPDRFTPRAVNVDNAFDEDDFRDL